MADIYFSGQGTVFQSVRDTAGNATAFRDLGNVPALRVSLESDNLEHKESRTGNRLTDLRITRERRAKITMTLENFSRANLMQLIYGTYTTVPGNVVVTNESFVATYAAGDMHTLAHPMIDPAAAFTITNAAGGTPLVEGQHFKVDKTAGMVTILDISITAQPYKANYTYLPIDSIPMFKNPAQEVFLRFAGLNTANSNKPVVVEFYRVIFNPVGNIDFINNEFAQFELEGDILYDATRDTGAAGSILGGFGRIVQ